jgi:hypothetical protein
MAASVDGTLFKEILAEMREHTLKRMTSPNLEDYVPSQRLHEGYSRLRSVPLPVSNDDELDDAIQQIRAVGNSGVTNAASHSESGITNAANAFQSDQNASEFGNKMGATRKSALGDVGDAINATYDKAEQIGANLNPSQQNTLLQVLDTLNDGFHAIWNKISGFILDAVRNVVSFCQEAPGNIIHFFADISSMIKSIF